MVLEMGNKKAVNIRIRRCSENKSGKVMQR